MTKNLPLQPSEVDAVVAAVRGLEPRLFSLYDGAWQNEVSMGLLDAVYSIQARYHAGEGKGVWNRLHAFRRQFPGVVDDLGRLLDVPEEDIRALMGDGKTSGVPKSVAVLAAAANLHRLGVIHARDIRILAPDVSAARFRDVKHAYISVQGLGKITFEYFLMLQGIPGVKADVMIRRFVARALGLAGEDAVSAAGARALVVAAHDRLHGIEHYPGSLTAFEHALWQHQRVR